MQKITQIIKSKRVKDILKPSEVEPSEEIINENNANLIDCYKYLIIPMPIFDKLSGNEAIIYSFLSSWESREKGQRFYFTNEQLANRFNISKNTVSNIIKQLKDKELINVNYRIKADGGKIRFINIPYRTIHDQLRGQFPTPKN